MKRLLLLICCIGLLKVAKGQQLIQERIYRIDGHRKMINTSCPTRQGNILLSGNYAAQPGFRALHMLVKPNTDTLWLKKGALLVNGDQGIKQTPDNGVIFLGMVSPAITGNFSDLILQKFDSTGLPKWTKTYAAGSSIAVLMAPDRGYFLATLRGTTGSFKLFNLIRTDSLGNIKWQKDFTWHMADYLTDMKYTYNGNIVLAGRTYDTNYKARFKLLVVNQNGDSILGKQITPINFNQAEETRFTWSSVTPLTDGGFLITGKIDTMVNSSRKFMGIVVKVDSTLQPVWRYVKRTVSVADFWFTKAVELTDGSVLVLTTSQLPAINYFQLSRFSATGTLLNTYNFPTAIASTVYVNTLDALVDSTYLIGGEAMITPLPSYTNGLYVAKVKLYGLPPSVAPPVVPPPVIIAGTSSELPASKIFLGQSYPNPTASKAIILYEIPVSCQNAQILIRDVTGREVGNYSIRPQSKSLEVNLRNVQNGLYAYTLFVDGKPVVTRKLAVCK
jgi:hypothetical protein